MMTRAIIAKQVRKKKAKEATSRLKEKYSKNSEKDKKVSLLGIQSILRLY